MPSSTAPISTTSTQSTPLIPSCTSDNLSTSTTIPTSSTSSSTDTAQQRSSKKKENCGPILIFLIYILLFVLLTISTIQAWNRFPTGQHPLSAASAGITPGTVLVDNGHAAAIAMRPAAFVQLGRVNQDMKDDSIRSGKVMNTSETRESPEGIASHLLAIRAVDTMLSSPPSPPPPSHDSKTKKQTAAAAPQPHIHSVGQAHTPATEGQQTGPKRQTSKKKLDGVTVHTASATHGHDNLHGHNQNSSPNNDGQEHNDDDGNAKRVASRNVVIAICVALGGLVGCFCCILGSSRLAICCYYRRLAATTAGGRRGGGYDAKRTKIVCVDGYRIGRPRPLSSSSSSKSLTGPHQPQQQMTEFWNVDSRGEEDAKKSPISPSTPKGGFFKTLRRSSFTPLFTNTNQDTTNPSRLLPLAVTAQTAHVISSPVDFIPPQHSLLLDANPTAGVNSLESYYPPYIGGWSNLDMPEHVFRSPAFSSTGSPATGAGATKSRRMPALSPRRSSQQLLASSPGGGGFVSPCTTTGSSSDEISPFPWSISAPYLQDDINSNNKHNDNDDRTTTKRLNNNSRAAVATTYRAQKPSRIDTTTALTSSSTFGAGTGTGTKMVVSPMTPLTTMMYTSPSTSTRSPLSFSPDIYRQPL